MGLKNLELAYGEGRTRISLSACRMGEDMVVLIYNDYAHVGAVAVAEYDHKEKRASGSLITRLGHKDDAVAQKAAYLISKQTRKPVCVIAGIHLDNITREEIAQFLKNAERLVDNLLAELPKL